MNQPGNMSFTFREVRLKHTNYCLNFMNIVYLLIHDVLIKIKQKLLPAHWDIEVKMSVNN